MTPLFVIQDVVALRVWPPSTWSKQGLVFLVPGSVAGQAVGWPTARNVPAAIGPFQKRLNRYHQPFFTVGNALKVGPWLSIAGSRGIFEGNGFWNLLALCIPVTVAGVWAGWRFHERIDQARLYQACYGLRVVTATLLLCR